MRVCPADNGIRNPNWHAMPEIRLSMICVGRGRKGRNLTARFVSTRGEIPGMIRHSVCSHSRFHFPHGARRHHFRLRRHRHKTTGRDVHTDAGSHCAIATLRTHVHIGGHRRVCFFAGSRTAAVTVGMRLPQPARQVTSRSRNRARNHEERRKRRQRDRQSTHERILIQS